jgi:anti-sigma B factor antagonist
MNGLDIKTEDRDGVFIVKTEGYIDTTTAGGLEKIFDAALKDKKYRVVLDLEGSDYVSSAGWGIFVGIKKSLMQNKGDIKLANMKNEVLEVYEVLDFTHILEYYKDTESAVLSFKKGKGK